jgi:hypothetical protein
MTDTVRDPDLARWLDVAKQAVQAQVAFGRASAELARSALAGDLDATSAGRAYAEAARRESAHYWRNASRLGAEYARGVADLTSQVATAVLQDVSQARREGRSTHGGHWRTATDAETSDADPATAAPADAAPLEVGLTLLGPLGGRATGSITVANRHPRVRRIELAAQPLVGEDGIEVAGATLELEPTRVTVPAGEERVVAVACDLTTGVLETGRSYRTAIQVTGGEEATITCVLAVV